MSEYVPLRVTFHLAEPVAVGAFPLHLDALSAYSVTQTAIGSGAEAAETHIRSLADNLPFHKEARCGEWVWAASALIPSGVGEQYVRMWRTDTPRYDYAERLVKGQIKSHTKLPLKPFSLIIDTQRGLMKNMLERYPVQHIDKFEAWCLATNEDDLYESLVNIHSLGGRRRVNHGRLKGEPVIEVDERARDLWKLRVLPWQEKDYVPMAAGIRPPYWAPENKRVAFCPASF